MVLGFKDGQYDRFVFCFDEELRKYESVKDEDVQDHELNFTFPSHDQVRGSDPLPPGFSVGIQC